MALNRLWEFALLSVIQMISDRTSETKPLVFFEQATTQHWQKSTVYCNNQFSCVINLVFADYNTRWRLRVIFVFVRLQKVLFDFKKSWRLKTAGRGRLGQLGKTFLLQHGYCSASTLCEEHSAFMEPSRQKLISSFFQEHRLKNTFREQMANKQTEKSNNNERLHQGLIQPARGTDLSKWSWIVLDRVLGFYTAPNQDLFQLTLKMSDRLEPTKEQIHVTVRNVKNNQYKKVSWGAIFRRRQIRLNHVTR